MSTQLAAINGTTVCQYAGGNGITNIQITSEYGYTQFNRTEVYQLIIELTKWLKEQAEKDRSRIQAIIANHKELEKTLFKEAVDCERFIADLQIIEAPLRLLELK